MSLVHIRVIRTYDTPSRATFDVQSTDFHGSGEENEWSTLGELEFDKLDHSYAYRPTALWISTCGYPKEFATPENQSGCNGLGLSPWARVIAGYAEQFLKMKTYPEIYPPIFDA